MGRYKVRHFCDTRLSVILAYHKRDCDFQEKIQLSDHYETGVVIKGLESAVQTEPQSVMASTRTP